VALKASVTGANAQAIAGLLDAKTAGLGAWLPVLPAFSADVSWSEQAVLWAQGKQWIPADEALKTTGALAGVSYTPAAKLLVMQGLTLKGPALQARVELPKGALVEPLAAYLDAPAAKRSLDALLAALPDASVDLNAQPAFFGALPKLAALPAGLDLNGTATLGADYAAGAGTLALRSFTYQRAPGTKGPLAEADLSGTVTGVKELPQKLNGPPENLLPHLGGLSIKRLGFDLQGLAPLLKAQNAAPALVGDLESGVIRFHQPLTLSNVSVQSPAANRWQIALGLTTHAEYRPLDPATKAPAAAPLAVLNGTVTTGSKPLTVNLADGGFSAAGQLDLGGAEVLAGPPKPVQFRAPKGGATVLAFSVARSKDGVITAPLIDVGGGTLSLLANNLTLNTGGPKLYAAVEKCVLREGPLTGTLSGVLIDEARDRATLRLDAQRVDFAKLNNLVALPAGASLNGALDGVRIAYDGAYSSLQKGAFTNTDKLEFSAGRMDVLAGAVSPKGPVSVALAGEIATTPQKLESKALAVRVKDGVGEQALNVALTVAPRAATDTLITAATAPGLPLQVGIAAAGQSPLHLERLQAALNAVAEAFGGSGGAPAAGGAKAGGMDAIRELRVDAQFTAPQLVAGTLQMSDVKVPGATLDRLKLVATAQAVMNGDGLVQARSLAYDLGSSAYAAEFLLQNVNLAPVSEMLAQSQSGSDYVFAGRLTGSGAVSGSAASSDSLMRGEVLLKGTVSGLTLTKQPKAKSAIGSMVASVQRTVTRTGGKLLGGILGGVTTGVDPIDNRLEGIGTGAELMSDEFGLFLDRLDFEDVTFDLGGSKGIYTLQPLRLVGRRETRTAGLDLQVHGGVNAPAQTFSPEAVVRLLGLTAKAEDSLGMTEIDAVDREAIRKHMAEGKLSPVVLRGKISELTSPLSNFKELFSTNYKSKPIEDIKKLVKEAAKRKREREKAAAEAAKAQDPNAAKQPPGGTAPPPGGTAPPPGGTPPAPGGSTPQPPPPPKQPAKKEDPKSPLDRIRGLLEK
jgi:hypothetical protein